MIEGSERHFGGTGLGERGRGKKPERLPPQPPPQPGSLLPPYRCRPPRSQLISPPPGSLSDYPKSQLSALVLPASQLPTQCPRPTCSPRGRRKIPEFGDQTSNRPLWPSNLICTSQDSPGDALVSFHIWQEEARVDVELLEGN